jgi:hypothetical protein
MTRGDLQRLDRSFQTEARAKPAPPDGRRRLVGALDASNEVFGA